MGDLNLKCDLESFNLVFCLAARVFFFSPGEHLRLCPQDYTCCSSQMEETLSLQSERDFLRAVEENSQFLLTTFTQRHRRFDGEAVMDASCHVCLLPYME